MTSLEIIDSSFEITADQIIQTSEVTALASSGSFNGVVYDFSDLSSPITDVTVDPLSTLVPVSVTFTNDSVAVNAAGESISDGSQYILDVTTGGSSAPTPEPSAISLVGLGLAGLAVVSRRRIGLKNPVIAMTKKLTVRVRPDREKGSTPEEG